MQTVTGTHIAERLAHLILPFFLKNIVVPKILFYESIWLKYNKVKVYSRKSI